MSHAVPLSYSADKTYGFFPFFLVCKFSFLPSPLCIFFVYASVKCLLQLLWKKKKIIKKKDQRYLCTQYVWLVTRPTDHFKTKASTPVYFELVYMRDPSVVLCAVTLQLFSVVLCAVTLQLFCELCPFRCFVSCDPSVVLWAVTLQVFCVLWPVPCWMMTVNIKTLGTQWQSGPIARDVRNAS